MKIIKSFRFIFLLSVLLFCFSSCQTLGKRDGISYGVKYVPLESSKKSVSIEGTVPVFTDKKLSGLNNIISDFKNTYINEYISDVEESWDLYVEDAKCYSNENDYNLTFNQKDFYYNLEPLVTEGNGFVSVVFTHSNYTGGAHSAYWANTFTWDVEKNCKATIYDVTGYSKKKISEICLQKIRKEFYGTESDAEYKNSYSQWVSSGVGENQVDAMKFYVEGNSVFVCFDPYEVGPWAMGQCIIQIK